MKIYTKTGDGGETGLFGGRRVGKDAPRVEAYGDVDELNAALGRAAAELTDSPLGTDVREIQGTLFALGADLATPAGTRTEKQIDRIGPEAISRLEERIDRLSEEVPSLQNFILPGGSAASAELHFCRAVCRRAERSAVRLGRAEKVNPNAIVYLNRLSDFLFVMARWENHRLGVEEPVWRGRQRKSRDPS